MPVLSPVLTDAHSLRENVRGKVVRELERAFPVDLKGRTLEVKDIKVLARDFSPEEQKHALLTGDSLSEPVKGTLVLKDGDGKIVNEARNFTLTHLPWFSERHTILMDGNEYQIANMLRRRPGAYTQRSANGELHTTFNLSKGANFNVTIDPAKSAFYLVYDSTNIPLYPVLRALGVTHEVIARELGAPIADANKALFGGKEEISIAKLYQKLAHESVFNAKASHTEKLAEVIKRFGNTVMDAHVTRITLGASHDKVTPPALLAAAQKLLRVHRGQDPEDDADSLAFKTFHSVDDFLAERVKLTAREWAPKARMALNGKQEIRGSLKPAPFSQPLRQFITSSALSAVPTGINPLELLDHSVKVTALGEGGIPSERAIPFSTRLTHATHFGILDPIRTPESGHAGVDIRATIAAHRDEEGNLYTPLRNARTNKTEFVNASDMMSKVIAFPHQRMQGRVDALHQGQVQKVDAKDVDYQQLHVSHTYSPATSLIPLLHSIQGNRAIMGSKMQTQGLPLLQREAPLVQVKHPDGGSYEDFYGRMVVPLAPVSGIVRKIEHGFIYIEPRRAKRAAEEEKLADRPVAQSKKHGPFTFEIEIEKGEKPWGHPFPCDYGYLPGFEGPDGDSLDFWVGDDPDGALVSVDTDEQNEDGEWKPADVKFIVGVPMEKVDTVLRQIERKPKTRCVNRVEYASWDDLKEEIEDYRKGSKTASYGRIWANHAAMNAGLAGRDVRYMFNYPGADGALASAGKRLPRLAADVVYGVLPPQLTHDDSLDDLNTGSLGEWFMHGYAPWENPSPAEVHSVKEAARRERELIKVPYSDNFPFPSKTRLHHTLSVKANDTVEMGQMLGDSNFTRNGTLASGLNARVAYMPYYGLNSNDAVVISEGFAKRMTSEHMYREVFPLNATIELSAKRHKVYFGAKYQPSQYAQLDETGVVKKGAKVNHHDLLVAGLAKAQVTGTDLMLGKISKTLTKPWQEVSLSWEHGTQGEVVDVVRTPTQIAVLVKTHEQMQVGDKLANRFGGKGVVAKIVSDKEMIKDSAGNPVELLMTSAGVVSRINPAQLHEALAGKIAEKTKKPIFFDNASSENAIDWVERLAKEHNVSGYEHVHDPVSGRKIVGPDGQGVFVGRSFIFKLFKSTDTNFAGHGVGPYDANEQPLKQGGEEGAKGLGKMEVDALLAHNARGMLSDAANIRGQKNEAFWRAIQLGQPLPANRPSFAFNKFQAMLEGAGVKVRKDGSKFRLLPATDADIMARSSGAVQNSKTLIAKNLKPEKGGLFDPFLTGGTEGTLYSHVDLHEAMPNPVFEEPIRRLLGLTEKRFTDLLKEKGGGHIKKELASINIDAKLKELEGKLPMLKASDLNNAVKQIKYLRALKAEGLRPENAYVLSKVPVIPPIFRPITQQKNNPSQLMVADANKLYGHLMDVNDAVKDAVLDSDVPKHRAALYNAVGAVFGTHTVDDQKLQKEEVKGFLTQVSGQGSPKGGFFQRKLMKRQQDVSGRGTAVPDGNLHMDAVSLPEDMLWQMFDKLLVARLVRKGYSALHARELVDKRAPAAKQCLVEETKERPVLLNRAPTLHRFGIVAAYAQPTMGKTIRVSPFVEKGFNLDYDGDTLQVHVPLTRAGIDDAKRMTMSHLLLSDQTPNKLMAFPQHEAIIGITHALKYTPNKAQPVRRFKTEAEAVAAWRRGEVKVDDPVEIG
jgi:DNA-directed RNA polymerase beta subunit